jgi:hypothetical protein
VAVALAGGYCALQWLGRNWGADRRERRSWLPGDEIVVGPMVQSTHAITISTPPETVWPWLVQMGYHRGGWYTYPWVDRFVFHMSNPSADRIIAEYQGLALGDQIPDGPPGTAAYEVVELVPAKALVLHSTTHLPPAWRDNPKLGAWIDWTWSFSLSPTGPERTRLRLRVRGNLGPWWVRALYAGVVVPADFVMARSMLRGIKVRAEALITEASGPAAR